MGGQIFISYRRDDSAGWAGRLSDRLKTNFPSNQIFMDVDTIDHGVDFVEAVEEVVGACDVLIAVIGSRWLTSSDRRGRRRLDIAEDLVRLEIATALRRGIRVVPALVEGATMPEAGELPDDLKALVRRNALEVSHTRFNSDCERLADAVKRALETARVKQERHEAERRQREEKDRLEAERREREEREQLQTEREQKERLEAQRREREEKERLETERDVTEAKKRLEAERRQKKEQERQEHEAQSPPAGPAEPSTSPSERKPRPLAGIVTLLALVIGLVVIVAIYIGAQRPVPKPRPSGFGEAVQSMMSENEIRENEKHFEEMDRIVAGAGADTDIKNATKEQPWQNSLGMKFVPVAGTQVLFSVWDTRVQDFETFVKSTDYDATGGMYSLGKDGWKQRGATWKQPGFSQGPTHPVVGVNWNDAEEFCKWLTKRERSEGDLPQDREYRLPKDEEWSAAVGLKNEAGSTPEQKNGQIKLYPWDIPQKRDKSWPPPAGAGNYAGEEVKNGDWPTGIQVIEGYNDGYPGTSPVGSFEADFSGLYDMGGNVWQWCEDWYNSNMQFRVWRGASWESFKREALLASYRRGVTPDSRWAIAGFRCVVAVESSR